MENLYREMLALPQHGEGFAVAIGGAGPSATALPLVV
jgi:hypothetical protein